MNEEKKELLIGATISFTILLLGICLGFRIGFHCGESSADGKYDQKYEECRDCYLQMRDAYFVLKENLIKRAKEKGVEL